VWGKKGAKSGSTVKEKASPRPAAASERDQFDYSAYYDKCYSTTKGQESGVQQSARGQFDDLVLLEDVSNEGIVEVSSKEPARARSSRASSCQPTMLLSRLHCVFLVHPLAVLF